ncbi:MAG: hypothetical protein WCC23_17820 [Acinetobacter calcoaceticus]
MTITIKSDNVTTGGTLGNVNGLKDQDYALLLDFQNGEYTKKVGGVITNLTEADVLTCTSNKTLATKPMTMDRLGNKLYVTKTDQTRWWQVKNAFGDFFGLLIENEQVNWFLNSATPITQTISNIPAGSTMVASCIGSGSITITGEGINPVTVTQDTPATITPQALSTTTSLTVTVTGTLSHVQVVRCAGFAGVHSPITTTTSRPTSGFDKVEINQALIAPLLAGTQQLTILIQSIPLQHTKDDRSQYNETRVVLETTALVAGLGLNKAANTNIGSRIVSTYKSDGSSQVSSGTVAISAQLNAPVTQVFSVGDFGFKGSVDGGNVYAVAGATGLNNVTRIRLAEGVATPSVMQGGNCVITKFAVFKKQLSDQEIKEFSKSWL